ncbi:hypothetical protein HMPREF1146_1872 [Prevotella sp. MSX73]|nr:hypothetical protein HMPREF1146_1872 [Prevotella sp. MSX73]
MSRKLKPLNDRGLGASLKFVCRQPQNHCRKISQAQGAKPGK